jgi:hypothetical protein
MDDPSRLSGSEEPRHRVPTTVQQMTDKAACEECLAELRLNRFRA